MREKSEPHTRPTRRSALSGSAITLAGGLLAFLLPGVSAEATSADAGLISACERLAGAAEADRRAYAKAGADADLCSPEFRALCAVEASMTRWLDGGIRPMTLPGAKAMARAAMAVAPRDADGAVAEFEGVAGRLALAVIDFLAGQKAVGADHE